MNSYKLKKINKFNNQRMKNQMNNKVIRNYNLKSRKWKMNNVF